MTPSSHTHTHTSYWSGKKIGFFSTWPSFSPGVPHRFSPPRSAPACPAGPPSPPRATPWRFAGGAPGRAPARWRRAVRSAGRSRWNGARRERRRWRNLGEKEDIIKIIMIIPWLLWLSHVYYNYKINHYFYFSYDYYDSPLTINH